MPDETTNTNTETNNGQELGFIEVFSEHLKNIDNFMSGNSDLTEVDCPFPYVTSAENAFSDCRNLTKFKVPNGFPKLTNASHLLYATGISQFTSNDIPMPEVTNAEYMLSDCKNLTTAQVWLDKALNVNNMFSYSSNLETVNIQANAATSADEIFNGCEKLKYVNAYFDTLGTKDDKTLSLPNGVQSFYSILPNVKTFKLPPSVSEASVTLNSITDGSTLINDGSSLTIFNGILKSVTGFNGKSFPNSITTVSLDAPKLTDGSNLFSGCKNLRTLSIAEGGLNSLSKGYAMFQNCDVLTIWEHNVPSLSDGTYMFSHCDELTKVKINGPIKIGSYMFYNCPKLTSAYMNLASLEKGDGMFKDAKELKYLYNHTKINGSNDYEPITSIPKLKDGSEMFYGTKIPTFGTNDNPITMDELREGHKMFARDSFEPNGEHFKTVNIVVPKISSFEEMFARTNIQYFGIGSDNSSMINWENIQEYYPVCADKMFMGCAELSTVTKAAFDTRSIVSANNMFLHCSNLSSFTSDLNELRNGYGMFCGCKLNKDSLAYIETHINNIRDEFEWEGDTRGNVKNESDWVYKVWTPNPAANVSDDPSNDPNANMVDVEIDPEHRGVIHVDVDKTSVSSTDYFTFKSNLIKKGWEVVTCSYETPDLSITDENGYTSNIQGWKNNIQTPYAMKVTKIVSSKRGDKTVGVMYGSSIVHPESGDSGTES